jgi:hypothetical protein
MRQGVKDGLVTHIGLRLRQYLEANVFCFFLPYTFKVWIS